MDTKKSRRASNTSGSLPDLLGRRRRKSRYDQLNGAPVDSPTERLKRIARINRSHDGKDNECLSVIFPNPEGPPQVIDLKRFMDFPNLCEPLTDAVLCYGRGDDQGGVPRLKTTRY